jgi:tyrosinase
MELVGTHDGTLKIKSSGARATVTMAPAVQSKVSESLAAASAVKPPDHVYLQLENVRGNRDAYELDVSVNQQNAGTVGLFGLRRASLKDGGHGGEGLSFVLDITHIIDSLFVNNSFDANTLDVRIVPKQAVGDEADLSIGRVSVYRQGQE